jgi:integrase
MNQVDRQMRFAALEAAVRVANLAEGGSIHLPTVAVRPRKDGNFRAYLGEAYLGTTSCATLAEAEQWRDTLIRQFEAEAEGIFDVRRLPVSAAIEQRKKRVVKNGLKGAKVIVSTLKAIEPHLKGLRLHHLTDEKMEEIGEAMVAEGYAREYYVNAARFLATAIRQYTKKKHGAVYLPYDPPPRPKGRTAVITKAERDRVKALYAAACDPKSGMTKKQRRDAEVAYMEFYLGLVFGSRPGAYEKLSWEQHDGGGWLDLDGAVFHRVPPGTETPGNKLADPVDIPPEVLAELRRWRKAAGGSGWVFRTLYGDEPLGQGQQEKVFKAVMTSLCMEKVTGHVLRHSFITLALTKGAAPVAVAAVASVSVETMIRRYAHVIRRAVQQLAHSAMESMMTD